MLVEAQHLAQIDATATSRIEAWDAKSLVVAFNSIGWIPVNIFFSAADMLTSASDYFYDHTSNDHPATLETGDRVRVDSGPHAGDVFEYKGAAQTGFVDLSPQLQDYDNAALWQNVTVTVSAVFDYTSTDTPATLEAGKRVKIPGGTNGLIYKYVGPTLTGPVNLTPGSGQDYTDTDLWVNSTPVFAGQRPSHAQALVVDTTIDAGGNVTVTATSGAQLNATVGNDNVVEAALDLIFPGAQTTTKTKDAKTGKTKKKVEGYGASGAAGGIVLAQNKVSTFARAAIVFTAATPGAIAAGGDVTVLAQDTAGIDSHSSVVQDVATTNDLTGLVPIVASLLPGDYQYTTASGTQQLAAGDRVRLGSSYAGGGDAGAVYEYRGLGLADLHRHQRRSRRQERDDEPDGAAADQLARAGAARRQVPVPRHSGAGPRPRPHGRELLRHRAVGARDELGRRSGRRTTATPRSGASSSAASTTSRASTPGSGTSRTRTPARSAS